MGDETNKKTLSRGRPSTQGIKFVPVDLQINDNYKIFKLKEMYSWDGFVFFLNMLAFIYKRSYFVEWTEENRFLFSKQARCSTEVVDEILEGCIKIGLFDEKIFRETNSITSIGIQTRWLEQVKRRSKVIMYAKNNLLDAKYIFSLKVHGFKLMNDSGDELQFVAKANAKAKVKSDTKEIFQYDRAYVRANAKAKWHAQSTEFKAKYNQSLFEAFVFMCRTIVQKYKPLLESDFQINFEQYLELFFSTKFTADTLNDCLSLISETTTYDTKIYECIKQMISKKQATVNSAHQVLNYI